VSYGFGILAYDRTSYEVTRVTTHRVTRGRLTSSDDVAADRAYGWADAAGHVAVRQNDRWRTDMAHTWANDRPTRGTFHWLVRVPRGPVKGCHVAPHFWLMVSM
jgi:hypothetical protein